MHRTVVKKRNVRAPQDGAPTGIADALAIDDAYSAYATESRSQRDPVVVDLSKLGYVSHDMLLHLGALIRWRRERRLETLLELPRHRTVIEFMRAWKFPEFIANVTQRDFLDSLASDSREAFKTQRDEPLKYARVIQLPGGGLSELLPVEHFQLTPIALAENRFRAATIAGAPWLEQHMLSVLDGYFGKGQGQRIGSTVVLEAVLNAAMHPQATMAYTSSQIVLPDSTAQDARPRLQIGIWDDGVPIALTLQSRIRRNLPIVSDAFGAFDESFRVRLVRSSGSVVYKTLTPRSESIVDEFPWLTVTAFLAGVSSVPERRYDETGASLQNDYVENTSAGMGLRYIRRSVLDQWAGEIRYWSNAYRMNMTAGNVPGSYDVTIQYRPRTAWNLKGNTLWLDIPVPERNPRGHA